jgi:hypothetical protein
MQGLLQRICAQKSSRGQAWRTMPIPRLLPAVATAARDGADCAISTVAISPKADGAALLLLATPDALP